MRKLAPSQLRSPQPRRQRGRTSPAGFAQMQLGTAAAGCAGVAL
jgi:hypothetical protein